MAHGSQLLPHSDPHVGSHSQGVNDEHPFPLCFSTGKRTAVCVGVNVYLYPTKDKLHPLEGCIYDVECMVQFLITRAI
ncbi:hypothetical protein H0H93_014056 [Arthromyces matolae]|nr:hypothetical protein H0H93_014056 [Arthromyces matolae]